MTFTNGLKDEAVLRIPNIITSCTIEEAPRASLYESHIEATDPISIYEYDKLSFANQLWYAL